MTATTQAQSFGDIRIEGQGNQLVINQTVQISARRAVADLSACLPTGASKPSMTSTVTCSSVGMHPCRSPEGCIAASLLMVAGASGSGKSSVVRGDFAAACAACRGFSVLQDEAGQRPVRILEVWPGQRRPRRARCGIRHRRAARHVGAGHGAASGRRVLAALHRSIEELFTLCDRADQGATRSLRACFRSV